MTTHFPNRRHALAWLASPAIAGTSLAFAQPAADYPAKPIQIVFPWSPGSDELLRILANELSTRMRQPVIVDYRPGAATSIGAAHVAKAPADGYTLLYGSSTTFAINPSAVARLPYDPVRDFAPISRLTSSPFFVFANPRLPVNTLGDFIALAKKRPGELSYATPGIGSVPHLSIERFAQQVGIRLIHVPYKGNGQLMTDVAGGHVDMSFSIHAYPFIHDQRVRGLAFTGAQRSPALPDLPTVAESGVDNYVSSVWFGLVAPAATPAVIVKKLNQTTQDVLSQPAFKARFAAQGIDLSPSTPDEFAAQIRSEIPAWREAVRLAGVTPT
ncbi:MAG: tripartite tricarboxylate transporter substrate binding protein [Polaromonas sp.]|nr:tripartite tricarboxylate transporter substrate binding protein [Polaromonas sp.]